MYSSVTFLVKFPSCSVLLREWFHRRRFRHFFALERFWYLMAFHYSEQQLRISLTLELQYRVHHQGGLAKLTVTWGCLDVDQSYTQETVFLSPVLTMMDQDCNERPLEQPHLCALSNQNVYYQGRTFSLLLKQVQGLGESTVQSKRHQCSDKWSVHW